MERQRARVGDSEGEMTRTGKAPDHLIVALDVPNFDQARAIVRELGAEVSFYKVGWHLFGKGLADFIHDDLVGTGKHVFLDFKTVDIGETMRGMISSVSRLGVEFVTVMGKAATIAAHQARRDQDYPKILTVTLLTDHGEGEMQREYNTDKTVEEFVADRAVFAEKDGADGVIASALEVSAIRSAVPRSDFLIVTPGIRPLGVVADDQRRTATPAEAIRAGADYLVVGRPIIRPDNKRAAAISILNEMQTALDERTNSGSSANSRRNRRSAYSASPAPPPGQPGSHSDLSGDPRATQPPARSGSSKAPPRGGGARSRRAASG